MRPGINVIMPRDFRKNLQKYFAEIRKRKGEYDKRNYMANKLMSQILGIKAEFIEFERDKVDPFGIFPYHLLKVCCIEKIKLEQLKYQIVKPFLSL